MMRLVVLIGLTVAFGVSLLAAPGATSATPIASQQMPVATATVTETAQERHEARYGRTLLEMPLDEAATTILKILAGALLLIILGVGFACL